MAARSRFLKHVFGGGWATDFGPTASVGIDQGNIVQLPWLNEAQNCVFELDGGPHKMPGRTANTSVLESGADIMGVFDAWFHGAVGTPTQHRILHVGTKIKKDNADDTFTDLFTGQTAGAVPCYSMLEDLLIISNDSGTDVPKSWDGTTAQSLAGTPPTFAFSCTHKNRVFAAGAVANPSRLYYSVLLNGADWAGAGSGTIDIDPSDGDRITAIASHRDDLWVFKGPYKGSIHRITGSSSTDFARVPFVTGVGAVTHRTVVPYANDLAFMWSDGSIRALSATASFGDFNETNLNRPIQSWVRDHVNLNALRFAQAVNWPAYSIMLFALPIDASSTNNSIIMMDYRFAPPRWSNWTAYADTICLASAVGLDSNKSRTVLAGGTDGILRTLGRSTRTIDTSTSISCNVQTPFLDYQIPQRMKVLGHASTTINPKSAGSFVFGWTRDNNAQQTISVAQNGSAVLDQFVLDVDMLGGGRFYDAFFDTQESGEFRAVQFQVLDNVSGQDIELHAISAEIETNADSWEV